MPKRCKFLLGADDEWIQADDDGKLIIANEISWQIGPPSQFQSKEIMILAQDPIYLSDRVFSRSIDNMVDSYSHETRAIGGYWSGSLTISGSEEEINEWFARGLGRHIEVYNPGLGKIWEGFVDRISVALGGRQYDIGPLSKIANSDRVRYSVFVDDSLGTGAMGGQEITSVANNTESQALYGIWEKDFSINGATLTDAEQIRDSYIDDPTYAFPATSQEANLSGSGAAKATIDLLGYWHWLKAYYYSAADGTENLSAKIENILTADVNGIFSTDYSKVAENITTVSSEASGKERAATIINDLVKRGDSSFNPYLAGVFNDRKFVYAQMPMDVEYQWRGNRGVTSAIDATIDPWDVQSGKWIFDPAFLVGRHPPVTSSTLGTDPRAGLIEVAKYTMPDGLSLSGMKFSRLDQILATRGMG